MERDYLLRIDTDTRIYRISLTKAMRIPGVDCFSLRVLYTQPDTTELPNTIQMLLSKDLEFDFDLSELSHLPQNLEEYLDQKRHLVFHRMKR